MPQPEGRPVVLFFELDPGGEGCSGIRMPQPIEEPGVLPLEKDPGR